MRSQHGLSLALARAGRTPVRYRRSPSVVGYWRGTRLIAHNYATGRVVDIEAPLWAALHACGDWRTVDELVEALQISPIRARDFVRVLTADTLLQRSDQAPHPGEAAMAALQEWNPAAGFFHASTRHVRFLPAAAATRLMKARARQRPMPPVVKRIRGAAKIRLPRPRLAGEFPQVLTARRTWRRFSGAPVSLADVGTSVGLAVGVQQWVPTEFGRLPLKTSPSGGARHPIEAYVCARTVSALPAGLYHYAADVHQLERIRRGDLTTRMRAWMPESEYFAEAAFLVVFTAVLDRQIWRYPYARAYRAALIEAGHVCQTFCLTATWLGLAPFCLMGLDDEAIERDLGIDGVRETVLYVAGAGARPGRTTWAPRPKGTATAVSNPVFRPA